MPLKLKKVKISDKEEVEELCKNIWEGNDYLPKVFDRWVRDGGFYKGVINNKIIALDKYTRFENDVIWLEGLRVHPDHQGQGYGKEMVKKFIELIRSKEEFSYLRFMTAATNEKTIKMAKEFGFETLIELHSLTMDREEVEPDGPESDVRRGGYTSGLFKIIKSSREFNQNKGLFIKNWSAHEIDEDFIKKEVELGNCFVFEHGDKLGVAFFDYYEPYKRLSIPFITGDDKAVNAFLGYAIRRVKMEDIEYLTIKTGSDRIKKLMLKNGFKVAKHEKAIVFER